MDQRGTSSLASSLGAVVTDFTPLREPLQWLEDVKKSLPEDIPLIQVRLLKREKVLIWFSAFCPFDILLDFSSDFIIIIIYVLHFLSCLQRNTYLHKWGKWIRSHFICIELFSAYCQYFKKNLLYE